MKQFHQLIIPIKCFDSEQIAPSIIEKLIHDGSLLLKQNELDRFIPTYIKSQTIETLKTFMIAQIGKFDDRNNQIDEIQEDQIPKPHFDSFQTNTLKVKTVYVEMSEEVNVTQLNESVRMKSASSKIQTTSGNLNFPEPIQIYQNPITEQEKYQMKIDDEFRQTITFIQKDRINKQKLEHVEVKQIKKYPRHMPNAKNLDETLYTYDFNGNIILTKKKKIQPKNEFLQSINYQFEEGDINQSLNTTLKNQQILREKLSKKPQTFYSNTSNFHQNGLNPKDDRAQTSYYNGLRPQKFDADFYKKKYIKMAENLKMNQNEKEKHKDFSLIIQNEKQIEQNKNNYNKIKSQSLHNTTGSNSTKQQVYLNKQNGEQYSRVIEGLINSKLQFLDISKISFQNESRDRTQLPQIDQNQNKNRYPVGYSLMDHTFYSGRCVRSREGKSSRQTRISNTREQAQRQNYSMDVGRNQIQTHNVENVIKLLQN